MDIEKLLTRFEEDFSRMGAFNHHGLVIRYGMLDEYQLEAIKQFLRKNLSESEDIK